VRSVARDLEVVLDALGGVEGDEATSSTVKRKAQAKFPDRFEGVHARSASKALAEAALTAGWGQTSRSRWARQALPFEAVY